MKKSIILICLILAIGITSLVAQTPKEVEIITLSKDIRINEALQILEPFFVRDSGKKLINLSSYNGPLGVPINNLNYKQALELILLKNNLVQTEAVGYIAIQDKTATDLGIGAEPGKAAITPTAEAVKLPEGISPNDKQILINAVVMLADKSYSRSLGIDWSTLVDGKVTVDAGFFGATQITAPMNLAINTSTEIGKYTVDINTLLKTIEAQQKGNILAKPNIIVSNGKKGHIQVGQDISIKKVDEAGNTIDTFFSTGVIMDVEPTVIKVEDEEVIYLKLNIERSSGVPSDVSTIITKSTSATELILFNKEEIAIAGLFDTDETTVRSGIPILKDLPWWVFGIRYLTGYNTVEKKERELIITIKAEILDSALERLQESRSAQM
jgi:type IV pilus assembly protein PilQ